MRTAQTAETGSSIVIQPGSHVRVGNEKSFTPSQVQSKERTAWKKVVSLEVNRIGASECPGEGKWSRSEQKETEFIF